MFKLSRRKLLLSSAALAAGAGLRGAFAQSDQTATLKLQAFGGDAELSAVTNAIARFNKKYPNVTVEISIDPISTGWGDYVTKVIGEFNAGSRGRRLRHRHRDLPGLLVARPVARPQRFRRGQFRLLGLRAQPVRAGLVQGGDPLHPHRLEQHHDQLQPRPVRQGRGRLSQARLDLGRVPRGRQGADRQGQLRQRHPVRLRGAEPELLRPAVVLLQRHRRAQRRLVGARTCSTPRSPRACSSSTT